MGPLVTLSKSHYDCDSADPSVTIPAPELAHIGVASFRRGVVNELRLLRCPRLLRGSAIVAMHE